MDIKISQLNFQNSLDKKGWSLTRLAKEYEQKYPDSNGKSVYPTLKKWNAGAFNPTITILYRVCDLLDCDIDYLLGKQETPRKEYAHIAEMTGLSYSAAENLVACHETGDPVISVLSALLENQETLQRIYLCVSADYGSISDIIEIPDVLAESGTHTVILNPRQVRQADTMELYNALIEFVDGLRHKYGLPGSKDL